MPGTQTRAVVVSARRRRRPDATEGAGDAHKTNNTADGGYVKATTGGVALWKTDTGWGVAGRVRTEPAATATPRKPGQPNERTRRGAFRSGHSRPRADIVVSVVM